MVNIKICGLRTMEDVQAVNEARPDYIGFVFAPGRRQVTASQAAAMREQLAPGIQAVGVFVNESVDRILSLVEAGIIDVIQLHGDETEQMILELKAKTKAPVIRAVRVRTTDDIHRAFSVPSDYLLFDTYTKDAYGGSGRTFDWSCIPPMERPYFLAGGLTPNNIIQAARTPAFCLDISSGVETDGRKDPDKIRRIVETIRAYNRNTTQTLFKNPSLQTISNQ